MAANGGNVADQSSVALLLRTAARLGVARLDAEVLLAALLGVSRTALHAHPEAAVNESLASLFMAGIERRAAGEPLAYITGIREFWSLPLCVTPAVLVPRPETETLVEYCLGQFDAAPRRVADLGTGSGAIALALARERPTWHIIATDADAAALQVAAINCARLAATNVQLRQGHWCEPLGNEQFDIIASNPPYIAADDAALAALQFEPQSALVADDAGYAALLRIAATARARLAPGAALLLEHGAAQAQRLRAELVELGYARVVCLPDLAGRDRITVAHWPA